MFYNQPAKPNKEFLKAFKKIINTAKTNRNIPDSSFEIEFDLNRILIIESDKDHNKELLTLISFDGGKFEERITYDDHRDLWVDIFIQDLNNNCAKHFTPKSDTVK